MSLRKFLFGLIFFQSLNCIAQEVKGHVFSESTGLPLADVNVVQKKTGSGTSTSRSGRFRMKLNIDVNDTIIFSHIGYTTKKIAVNDFKKWNNKFFLTELTEELNEVSLIGAENPKLQTLIRFKRLLPLKKAVHSFAAVTFKDSLWIIGGDESYEEDTILKMRFRNPILELSDIIEQAQQNMSWPHYSGKIQSYDILNETWKTLGIKIRNRAYHDAQVYQNKIYIFGGKRLVRRGEFEYLDDKIEVLDLKTGQIELDHVNPHQAASFSSFINGDNLLVIGGATNEDRYANKTYTDKLHEYNFTSGYWYELGILPEVGNIRGTRIGDYYYAVIWSKYVPARIYSYNLNTGVWTNEIQPNLKLESPAITSIDNAIYLFENNRISSYNIKTKSFKQYQINLNIKGSTILGTNNELYIVGGYKENEYSKTPLSGFYRINLSEFERTKFKELSALSN